MSESPSRRSPLGFSRWRRGVARTFPLCALFALATPLTPAIDSLRSGAPVADNAFALTTTLLVAELMCRAFTALPRPALPATPTRTPAHAAVNDIAEAAMLLSRSVRLPSLERATLSSCGSQPLRQATQRAFPTAVGGAANSPSHGIRLYILYVQVLVREVWI